MAFFGPLRFGHWGKIIAWPEGDLTLHLFMRRHLLHVSFHRRFKAFRGWTSGAHSFGMGILFEFLFLFAFFASSCFDPFHSFVPTLAVIEASSTGMESSDHFYIHTFLEGFQRRRLRCFLVAGMRCCVGGVISICLSHGCF